MNGIDLSTAYNFDYEFWDWAEFINDKNEIRIKTSYFEPPKQIIVVRTFKDDSFEGLMNQIKEYADGYKTVYVRVPPQMIQEQGGKVTYRARIGIDNGETDTGEQKNTN